MSCHHYHPWYHHNVLSDGVISKKELTRLVKDMYGMIKSESPETVRIIEIVETFEKVIEVKTGFGLVEAKGNMA